MAKRGRPRKNPEAVAESGSSVAVLEPKADPGIYSPSYSGRRYWLLGIKIDAERGQIPFHHSAFGGTAWKEGTQNQVVEDGWLALDQYRIRLSRELLSAEQVKRAVSEIRQKVVRWKKRRQEFLDGAVDRWAADVLSLEHRIKTYDKKKEQHVPSGYRYTAGLNDVPVSRYLVFIPRTMLEGQSGRGKLYEPDIESMDSMLDLDPTLVPDRMTGRDDPDSGGDEVW